MFFKFYMSEMKRIGEILVNYALLAKFSLFKITFGVSYIYAGFRTNTPGFRVSDQVHHFANFKKTNKL